MTNNLKHTTHQWCRKVNPEPDKFEDDEFKEDNKALNDKAKARELIIFVLLKLFIS